MVDAQSARVIAGPPFHAHSSSSCAPWLVLAYTVIIYIAGPDVKAQDMAELSGRAFTALPKPRVARRVVCDVCGVEGRTLMVLPPPGAENERTTRGLAYKTQGFSTSRGEP